MFDVLIQSVKDCAQKTMCLDYCLYRIQMRSTWAKIIWQVQEPEGRKMMVAAK